MIVAHWLVLSDKKWAPLALKIALTNNRQNLPAKTLAEALVNAVDLNNDWFSILLDLLEDN